MTMPRRGELSEISRMAIVSPSPNPAVMLTLYGTGLLQSTETGDVGFNTAAANVLSAMVFAVARQVASTTAETLKEALAVAATAGLGVKPDARTPKTKTGNAFLIDTALPLTRQNC